MSNRIESLEIKIEGLYSLKSIVFGLHTAEAYSFSIRNHSLRSFCLNVPGTIDEQILTLFLNELPNIEQVSLHGNFSYFNLDNLVNLKSLVLKGTINEDFNFELFKNLCNQLQKLSFSFKNCEYESIDAKLFDGHYFPNLKNLFIFDCNVRKLNKKFIDRFPALLDLSILQCNLETIEDDAFSNIKNQLIRLNLCGCTSSTFEKIILSQLTNLEELQFRNSQLLSIHKDMFSNMKNLKELTLCGTELSQLDSETLKWINNLDEFYP